MKIYQICYFKDGWQVDDYIPKPMRVLSPQNPQIIREWVPKHMYRGPNGYKSLDDYEPLKVVSYGDIEHPQADLIFWDDAQGILILNTKARELLEDLLQGKGTFLPLDYQGPENYSYSLFRPEREVEALDVDKCYGIEWREPYDFVPEDEPVVDDLPFRAFDLDKVQGETIFLAAEYTLAGMFVNQEFKERVESSDLVSNLCFPQIWDSEDPDFIEELLRLDYPEGWPIKLERWKREGISKEPRPNRFFRPTVEVTPLTPRQHQGYHYIVGDMYELYHEQSGSDDASPLAIVQWLNGYVDTIRKQELEEKERHRLTSDIGMFWGEQVIRHHGWSLELANDMLSVVAPDKSRFISLADFIGRFMFNDDTSKARLTLMFENMHREGLLIGAEPNAYVEIASIYSKDQMTSH